MRRLIVPLALIPVGLLTIQILRAESVRPDEAPASSSPSGEHPDAVTPLAGTNSTAGLTVAANVSASPNQPASPNDAIAAWFEQNVQPPAEQARWLQRGKENPKSTHAKTPPAGSVSGGSGFHAIWPLAIVLTLIVGLAFFLRKWMPRTSRHGGGAIDVLARQPLSGKQSLCLVKVGRRVLLVGVSPEHINPITEIGEPEEVAHVLSAVERGRPGSFTNMFSRLSANDWPALADESAPVVASSDGDRRVPSVTDVECPLPGQQLAQTSGGVRDLLAHVRRLSQDTKTSAEPTV